MQSIQQFDLSKPDQMPIPKSVERLGNHKDVMWMRWELIRLSWNEREELVTHMPEEHIRLLEGRIHSPQTRAAGM